MKKYLLLCLLLSVLFCQTAMADFYKWIDEKGETQITDYPPPVDQSAKSIEVYKSASKDATMMEEESSSNKAKKKVEVILYTRNDCKDCDKARDYLTAKNLPFTEYNTDTDVNAAVKRKELDSGDEVPFAIINKNHVYGFSETVYERVLKMEP